MASKCNSLLWKISFEDEEAGRLLKDLEIIENSDLQALCYESLKDIFPGGGKKIVQRSKVWKIIQNSLKGVLFKQLKRRLSNCQPTKNPQGPCPKKKRQADDKTKSNITTPADSVIQNSISDSNNCIVFDIKKEPIDPLSDDENNDDDSDNLEVFKRHYKAIKREQEKKKPNPDVLNAYLNKEYEARREWLMKVPAEDRCHQLLKHYSCFKDHVEIIEEARRVLQVETTQRDQFMGDCVKRLAKEVDYLIYFAINTKGINPPSGPKFNTKIVHVLKHLSTIFSRQKPLKKTVDLVHELKDHEDPNSWGHKQVGNVPVLVFDEEFAYVIVGKHILTKIAIGSFAQAVVAFLAAFYLLDFDYSKCNEIGLNILQVFIFEDNRTPVDIASPFNAMLLSYRKYKSGSC